MADAELPEWLSADRLNGGAGETTVTFSAESTLDGRTAEIRIGCAGKTQIVNVIQGLATVEKATCADIIAGPEGKTFLVTGTCVKIVNTVYGNWYIEDGTTDQEIQIYGTLDEKGNEKNFLSLGIEVGDEVTVQGPKSVYNGLVELVNVTVINIQKSLIKVDSVYVAGVKAEEAVLPLEGDKILDAYLSCKGNGVNVEIPEDAKSWLSIDAIKSGENPVVSFKATRNDGGDRSTVVVFKTKDGKGKEYSSELAISQKGAILEVSIADFLAAAVGDTQYRLTGVITKVANTDYGNVYIRDWSGEAYVYGIGAKGDFAKLGIGEGDIVTLVGKRGEYNGNAQMTGGQFEKSIITVKGKTLKEIASAADDPAVYYLATGTLKEIANNDYGNVWLSDASGELYVYGCYPGWGATGDNRKGAIGALGIKVGDKLSVIGVKGSYNDAPQIGNGIYFSHEEGEPGPEPQGGITIDGNPADWEGLAGVASATCPSDAELTGIKSAKVYYDDRLYILTEFSDEALAKGVADGKLRFHVFFSGAEGLLSRFWKDENIQYMMEGKATSGGAYCDFSSPLYKFTGATSADWSWESTGISPTMESAGSGNFYELAFDYSDYPGGFPEQIEIGIDCADGDYNVTGYAPQGSRKFCLKKGEVVVLPDIPDGPGFNGPKTIAEMVAAIPASATNNSTAVEFEAQLDAPAVVSYVNGGNAYIQDATGAILIYMSDHGFKAGDTIKGKISAKGYWYNGIPELVAIGSDYEKGEGEAPAPKEITIAELLANYDANLLRLVKISGVTVSGAIADGDRSGEITQGSDKVAVYAQLNNKGLVLEEGKKGDLITIPGKFKENLQVYFWDNAWFTAGAEPGQTNITIDGDMSDWSAIPGAEPASVFNAFKVWNDADNFYFYVETDPGSRLWSGGAYLYLYFDWDNDLTTGEYSGATGMGDNKYEAYTFVYIFENNHPQRKDQNL